MVDTTGFHAGGGWFFRRIENEISVSTDSVVSGRVEIRTPAGTVFFDKDTWASIVASVSAGGEGAESFIRAEALHEGRSPYTEVISDA